MRLRSMAGFATLLWRMSVLTKLAEAEGRLRCRPKASGQPVSGAEDWIRHPRIPAGGPAYARPEVDDERTERQGCRQGQRAQRQGHRGQGPRSGGSDPAPGGQGRKGWRRCPGLGPRRGSRPQDERACSQEERTSGEGEEVIILGVILMIIGFVAAIPILWTVGIILVVIGLALALLGAMGHAVGGRRHYY